MTEEWHKQNFFKLKFDKLNFLYVQLELLEVRRKQEEEERKRQPSPQPTLPSSDESKSPQQW